MYPVKLLSQQNKGKIYINRFLLRKPEKEELLTRFELVTSSLPRMRSTY